MRTPDEIVALWEQAKKDEDPVKAMNRQILAAYQGEIALPLPEMDRNDVPAVVNTFVQGVDSYGNRGSASLPDPFFAPQRPGMKKWEEAARTQRHVALAWWEHNRLRRVLAQRYRWYFAYGSTPVVVKWDAKRKMPCFEEINPMDLFTSSRTSAQDITPSWAIIAFQRDRGWLRRSYPDVYATMRHERDAPMSDRFQLLEYHDSEQRTTLVVGRPPAFDEPIWGHEAKEVRLLDTAPNRTDLCAVVNPSRTALGRTMGQFDGMLGPYVTRAMLTSLGIIATKRGIFADKWFVGRGNETPNIITQADGLRGTIGVVSGADLQESQTNPGYMTNPMIDRLEAAERATGGVPVELGGESGSNIRTGRRGAQLLGSAVDFPLKDAQESIAESGEEELVRATALDKLHGGSAAKTIYMSWKGAAGRIDYTPNDLWQNALPSVSYAYAGTDPDNMVISNGQRVGMGVMSKRTFMENDPMVSDAELEMDRVTAEGLEAAFLSSIQTQAANPEGPYKPNDFAEIVDLVLTNKASLPEAVQKVNARIQKEQAEAQQPAPPDPAMRGMPAPEQMPGMGSEVPPPVNGEAMPGMAGLDALLGQLTGPRRVA